jgi:hypothetical protein
MRVILNVAGLRQQCSGRQFMVNYLEYRLPSRAVLRLMSLYAAQLRRRALNSIVRSP